MAGEGAGKPPACTWGVSFPCGLKRLADDAQHETVICVRYLALIDETNRRLSATFYREPGRAQLS
jgi:hypothetical protein